MRQITYTLVALVLFSSCGDKTPAETTTKPKQDSAVVANTPGTGTKALVEDGPVRETYPDGKVKMEGEIKNGTRFGTWTAYYPDGVKQSECDYEDGKKNGKTATFYKSGRVRYIGYYTWDKPSGTWEFYDENGQLATKKEYK